jgi:dynactin complex subunit
MYNNDDIISEVREVQEQNYALEEKIDKLTKLVEGLQAQLGNEVDALAKLQMPNFEESMDALEKLTIRKGA